MAVIGFVLGGLLMVYEWVLIARAIESWILVVNPRWTPRGPLLLASEFIYTVTDPPLNFLKKFIKPLRLGNISLDLAFLVLFVLVMLAMRLVVLFF